MKKKIYCENWDIISGFRSTIAAMFVVVLLSGASSSADDLLFSFDIPSQRVQSALIRFADLTDLSLVYDSKDFTSVDTNAVHGRYDPLEALDIMLGGTGLVFERTGEHTIAIRKRSTQSYQNSESNHASRTAEVPSTSNSQSHVKMQASAPSDVKVRASVQSEDKPSEEYVLKDTIVTATKTGETMLQETPIAITVFDDEALQSSKMFRLTELDEFIPNTVIAQQASRVHLYMRGIGTPMFSSTGSENTVGFYIDGVYIEKAGGAKSAFFDIERIEVVRGPQGVLFGRNATGGAINLITKAPTDELEIRAQVEMGSYSKRRYDFVISGPILKDKINGRFSLFDSQHDGYTNNVLHDPDGSNENVQGFRGSLDFMPTDGANIRLAADYMRRREVGVATKLIDHGGVYSNVYPIYGMTYDQVFFDDFYTYASNPEAYMNSISWGISLTADIELPHDMNLRSITAYREHNPEPRLDINGSSLPDFWFTAQQEYPMWSQELQLRGKTDRWNWLLGAYFYNSTEYWNNGHEVWAHTQFFFGTPEAQEQWKNNVIDTTAYAFFGQATYDLTDKLSAILGVRYSHDTKDGWMIRTYKYEVPPIRHISDTVPYIFDGKWTGWTPKVGLDYRITDEALIYVSAAKGWKSGMFYPNNPSPFSVTIPPETIWTYSIGAKTDWLGKRLRANLEVFSSDYRDQQIAMSVDGKVRMIAGDADIQGVELEMTARPLQRLTVNGAFSYLDTEYTDLGAADFETGGPLGHAPEFSAALSAEYTIPIKAYGYLSFRSAATWKDDFLNDPTDGPEFVQWAYTLISGFIRYETADGRWNLEVYGTNLTDEKYCEDRLEFMGDERRNLGMPRFFGIQVGFRY